MVKNPMSGAFTGYVPTAGSSVGTDANTMQYLCGLNVGASIHARNVQSEFDSLAEDAAHEREMREIERQTWEYQRQAMQNERDNLVHQANAIIEKQNETIRQLQATLKKEKQDCDHWYKQYSKMVDNIVNLNEVLKKHSIPKPALYRYDAEKKDFVKS
jgi:hypothetical protein